MFGQTLAKLRKERNLSQYKLAELMNLSRGQIANYEQGSREPDFNTLERFADFFDVSTDFLLGRSSHPKLSSEEDKKIDKEVEELMQILESMPEEKRKKLEAKIIAYAQGFADSDSE